MLDYPQVRSAGVCPLCLKCKDTGSIVCWYCYHAFGLRYGNQEAEDLIAKAEAKLSEEVERRAGEFKSV